MSKLATAVDRAESVSGEKSAARLYNDLEYELALGAGGSEEDYEQGEQALSVLEQRFPGVERQAREITSPPKLSRNAGETLHGGRTRGAPLGAQTRREHDARRRAGATTRLERATVIHARRRSSSSSFGGRRLQQTGLPGGAESGTRFVMRTIGAVAGMSLLYLLLTPNGSRAVSATFGGLTAAFRGFASPHVDPLNKSTYASAGPIKGPNLAGGTNPTGSAITGAANSATAAIDSATAAFLRAVGAGVKPKPGPKPMTTQGGIHR